MACWQCINNLSLNNQQQQKQKQTTIISKKDIHSFMIEV